MRSSSEIKAHSISQLLTIGIILCIFYSDMVQILTPEVMAAGLRCIMRVIRALRRLCASYCALGPRSTVNY
ncbi:hypothetical protein BDV24DRAFT_131261 [Aspergillus arachidicola]|uniref:Uncharacterized protein n=1 Tax=Aspergillus arachidicola TaxID=656916 RepID=A0A5N6Y990_9EURO|nr:hypothetical protein BDV24DRAFT_131261 [Aspergillus arachidicola]